MKINEKPYLMFGILFGAITICLSFLYLLNYVNGETMAIFSGVTQLFLGFSQINRGNKKVGMLCVIVGIVIVINVIIKMMM